MWPVIVGVIRVYLPYIVWPVGAVIGVIGYNFEALVGRKETPYKEESVQDERLDRKLEQMTSSEATNVPTLKSKYGIPKTVLDRNDKSKLQHTESESTAV
ncbi:hypothetical protein FSP39_022922 [Pinctada imbricata]|uniref:Small integral membrane protein 12 n=1 Tax=Pinctada imbricata TaxID=66713 RepID=A0AA88XY19_PINIB|nr:hypothetical protein FSP39_022922 [Pinctada imbricata]